MEVWEVDEDGNKKGWFRAGLHTMGILVGSAGMMLVVMGGMAAIVGLPLVGLAWLAEELWGWWGGMAVVFGLPVLGLLFCPGPPKWKGGENG